ncbi:MAG TPA: hypothetical protein VFW96_05000 [Thermomicrobiales bacterium]|nr:hypothetical protein [Thermomicrobiales bacterium]
MSRLLGSFLLRCWWVGRDDERFELEHIQSGERLVVASLADAYAWVQARARVSEPGPDGPPGAPEGARPLAPGER